jgi:hypothetical protein
MKPSALVFLSLASLFPFAALAAETSWSLGDCNASEKNQARWQAFEAQVRSAKPGSLSYVPKPYPRTDLEVIADYLYQYKSLHREALVRADLPANELPVLDGILGQTVKFRVTRVENWTPLRCAADKPRQYYHLIQVTSAADGRELTRVVLDPSGLLFLISNASPETAGPPAAARRQPWQDLPEAMAAAQSRFGLAGSAPQYVATFGSLDCNFADPCLAFRHGAGAYLLYRKELFELPVTGKRLIQGRDVGIPQKNVELQESLRPDEGFLSLGGSAWTVARKVDAARLRALAAEP